MKSNISRRAFVSSAAALTIFNIGCAGFGASRARRIAAGEKIRLGLIGCHCLLICLLIGVLT